MAGVGLTLVTPQDIQLDIQMPKNIGARGRLILADIFMAKGKYKGFMA